MRKGSAAVTGAALVLAIVLVAGPLYVASVGSAAVQRQFDERCPGRIALSLPGSPGFDPDRMARAVEPIVAGVPTIATPTRTTFTPEPLRLQGIAAEVEDRFRMLHRPGALDNVEVVDGPAGAGVWLPASWAATAGLGPGSSVRFQHLVGFTTLPVAGTYRDLVSVTPPRPFCALIDFLRPNPFGDAPPPLFLLDDATFTSLPRAVEVTMSVTDELPVRRDGLTLPEADRLAVTFASAADAHALQAALSAGPNTPRPNVPAAATDLPFLVRRAHGIVDLVQANVVPVRTAGGLAGAALAVAAGALATRRRRDELHTRATRGEGPLLLGARVAGEAVPAALVGAAAGAALAVVTVRALGPSTDLGPIRDVTVAWAAVAALVTVAAVGLACGVDARSLVDPPARRPAPRWLRGVPWEIVPLAAVALAGVRLVAVGGAQFVGDETTGSDAVALSFPVLASAGVALVLLRPAARAARALRHRPRDADPAVVLGARRLAHDPAGAAGIAAAIALASATTVLGSSFADSAEAALRAKARTFVGSDVAIAIAGTDRSVPAALAGRATVVDRIVAHSGDTRVNLLGVDPATYAAGSGATGAQAALVEQLGPPGPTGVIPAIVVGDLPSPDLELYGDLTVTVAAAARPAQFPMLKRGSALVVVRRDALPAGTPGGSIVLAHGDPVTVEAALRDDDRIVLGVVTPGEVISATSFAAVRWAYDALRALGVLVLVVLVGVQLTTAAARAPRRRVAEVLTSAMGLGRWRAFVAVALEHGAPLVVGAASGLAAAGVIALVAVPRLDSARSIPPTATTVMPTSVLLAVTLVGIGAVVVATAASRRLASRARAVDVLRGG